LSTILAILHKNRGQARSKLYLIFGLNRQLSMHSGQGDLMASGAVSIRSWLKPAVTLLVLGSIIALAGVGLVARTTERMLRADAAIEAQNWAIYLARNVPDFREILSGKKPSSSSLVFFSQSRQIGRVYRFLIYDRSGRLHLRSDDLGQTNSNAGTLRLSDPEAASALHNRQPIVRVGSSDLDGETLHFAEAVVPIIDKGSAIGILQVFISQNQRRELFLSAAVESAVTVGVLLAIGPAFGFWYRTRQKRSMEQQLDFVSTHDPLTRLMNRPAWLKSFDEALSKTSSERPLLTAMVVNVSGIRVANETFGNAAGDHLLKVSADRLAEAVGSANFLSRIGGNQFGVLASPFADPMDVARLAQNIIRDLSQPVTFNGNNLHTGFNIGVAMTPTDGSDQIQLVKAAEVAVASAHAAGRNQYQFFNASVEAVAERQRSLERFAREAIDLDALDLHFQPIIGLQDGRLKAFEALLRIRHPQLGALSPAEFVAAAERSGDIERIGAWCLEHACRIAKQWPDDLTIAVNLSPVQFNSGRLISNLRRILDNTHFPAYRLELEITEGIMLDDSEFIHIQLRSLQEMGVRVALDDFGTGYSSLSYLWKFPFSRIKIDQSFVRQMVGSPTAQGIVSTIVSLGRSIGVPLTAEGIETLEELAYLKRIKCEYGQGYLFSRPVPATELAALILKDFSELLPAKRKRLKVVGDKAA
jgi:diguanylate cyclase (GGDEF)-like protein